MLLNGLKHLRAHHVAAKATHFLTQFKEPALIEFEIFGTGCAVDILNDITLAVGFALVGFYEEVITLLDPVFAAFGPFICPCS